MIGYQRFTYKGTISLAESKYSLKEGSLNVKTLLTRVKQGKLNHSGRGHVSPMLAATCINAATFEHKGGTRTDKLNGKNSESFRFYS